MGEPGEGRDMQERPGAGLPVSLSPGLLISLSERCAAIELLVLDVDGVLTDGAIVWSGRSAGPIWPGSRSNTKECGAKILGAN